MRELHDIVIVGASLAGLRAAEAARARGYTGKLTLIGAESYLPYDRPPLSKDFLAGSESVDAPYFDGSAALAANLDVSLMLGRQADGIDVRNRTISVGSDSVHYDAALIATGASPRRLPGTAQLQGVSTLRTLDDAQAVGAALRRGDRLVVIGGGFIGSEVASAARAHDLPVTIVEASPTPLVRAVGATAGEWLSRLHERNGTELICGTAVDKLTGTTRVESVVLSDGRTLPADLVVVGIGADPSVDWIGPDQSLRIDNGLECDATLRAGADIWAAGDVCSWWSQDFERHLRIEHWTNAAEQAAHAMNNLLDPVAAQPYRHIPYFWSDWYGSRIQLVGLPSGEPTVVTGDSDSNSFVALFESDGRLMGALALNKRSDVMKYRALIARGGSWNEGLDLAEQRNKRHAKL